MRVVHCRKASYTHYIGRPSSLGNPFTHITERRTAAIYLARNREDAIAKFETYARETPEILNLISQLPEEAILGCWCAPQVCHGDVIVRLWKELAERGIQLEQ